MQSQEVDLAQHGSGTDDAFAVLEKVCAEGLDERGGVVGDGAGGDFGVEAGWDGLPAVCLHDGDDLGGLVLLVYVLKGGTCNVP